MVDFKAIRAQFPILDQEIHGHPLVYLDSAATSQKPNAVIDAEANFYRTINAGVHRGAHELAARSTMAFEEARAKVAKLVGANAAEGEEEVVVTGGATAGLNLLATAFGNASLGRGGEAAKRFALKPGDEIVVSRAEHHSVLLPFQELSYRTGATFKWIDLTEDGRVRTDNLDEVITEFTALVRYAQARQPLIVSRSLLASRRAACAKSAAALAYKIAREALTMSPAPSVVWPF